MAKHSFTAAFSGPASDTVAKARDAIQKAGGTFDGDDAKGGFSVSTPLGAVKGTYTIAGQDFSVQITDKPFLLPDSAIEAQVRKSLTT
jgi:hypothetical protein